MKRRQTIRSFFCRGFCVAGLLTGATGRADLAWTHEVVELRAAEQDPGLVLEGRFPFKNTGTTAVNILSAEPSCGCTTTKLERKHFAQGESGEIVARFVVGSRTGRQESHILVKTSDRPEPVVLRLVVQIPQILRIDPVFVYWVYGEAKNQKTIALEFAADKPLPTDLTLETVTDGTPAKAELRPGATGRQYEISVTPGQNEKIQLITLRLSCRFEVSGQSGSDRTRKTFTAYAIVRPPSPPRLVTTSSR